MGQLKVRFTIEHQNVQNSFVSLSDLKQHSFSDLLLDRLNEFENRLKRAAADAWLQQKLGKESHSNLQLTIVQEEHASELSECMIKA